MTQNIRFRYYLRKDDTTYYYLSGRTVLTTIERRPLIFSPANWKTTKLSFIRNVRYWGVFREVSVALQFIKDAAAILREIYYSQGFEGKCVLEMEKWNTYALDFESFYKGDLNFSTVVDERNYVTLTVLDRGLPDLLKTREDTPYEIPIDGDPDAIDVLIDGVKVRGSGSWYPGNYSADADNGLRSSSVPWTTGASTVVGGRSVTLHGSETVDQIATFIRPHDQYGATGNTRALIQVPLNPGNPDHNDGDYIFYANTDLSDIIIDGFMLYTIHLPNVTGSKNVRVRAFVVNLSLPSPSIVASYILHTYTTTGQDVDEGVSAKMDFTIPSIPGGCYLLITIDGTAAALSGATTTTAFFPIEFGYFRVSFLAKVAPTFTKGFRIIDLCKKLIEKLSDGEYSVISNYLSNQSDTDAFRKSRWDTLAYSTVLTSGDAVRGLPNAVVKITWSDMYAFLWASESLAAMPRPDGLHIESLRDAFSQDIIYTLEGANNISVMPFMEVVANQYRVGYENYDNENVAGKNEYNTGTTFLQDSILRAPKKEDVSISPIRFDPYGIESARAETFAENRKDYKSDNNIFGLEIDPTPHVDGYYILWRPSPAYVTGVDDPPDAYNLGRTPFRALGRKLPFVRSIKPSGNLVFQTTDKNPELISDLYSATLTADGIQETETIPLEPNIYKGRDVSAIFQPNVIMLDAIAKSNLYNLAVANPYGLIQFYDNGVLFKGWVLDVGINPATYDVYPTRLLSHPDNDLRLLKH